MPAPAKIRSRLRLGRAERDGFSCLTARRVARRWRRKSRAAGFVIESGAGVLPRLFYGRWPCQRQRKSGAGCGLAEPNATDFRALPPGGPPDDGGANPAQRDLSSNLEPGYGLPRLFYGRWPCQRHRKSGAGCDRQTRQKIFGPAASVVCRRANIVLRQFPPGEVELQGRRGRQTVPLKGQRIHRRGCAFAEGCRL